MQSHVISRWAILRYLMSRLCPGRLISRRPHVTLYKVTLCYAISRNITHRGAVAVEHDHHAAIGAGGIVLQLNLQLHRGAPLEQRPPRRNVGRDLRRGGGGCFSDR